MYIAVTGYAGIDGSRIIYEEPRYRDRLKKRYAEGFFAQGSLMPAESPGLESLYREKSHEGLADEARSGGILAALWRILKAHKCGGSYSLRDIPILQQTIEICEFFNLNPYRLHAPSCRIWLVEDPCILYDAVRDGSGNCSVIGWTAGGTAIRRTDDETGSTLRRPEPDELFKLFPGYGPDGA